MYFLINFYHFAKKFSKNDQNFYKFINIKGGSYPHHFTSMGNCWVLNYITFFPLSFINIYHYFKIKKTVCEQNQK